MYVDVLTEKEQVEQRAPAATEIEGTRSKSVVAAEILAVERAEAEAAAAKVAMARKWDRSGSRLLALGRWIIAHTIGHLYVCWGLAPSVPLLGLEWMAGPPEQKRY